MIISKLIMVFKMSLYLFCLSLVLAELPEEKEFYKLLGLYLTVSIPLPFLTKLPSNPEESLER